MFGNYVKPIFLFAVVGTVLSAIFVALLLYWVCNSNVGTLFDLTLPELAAFGALISATDPVSTLAVFQEKRVNLQLFYLVFGESVMNDAVGIVLFDSAAKVVEAPEEDPFNWYISLINLVYVFFASFLMGIIFAVLFALIFKHVKFIHSQLIELSIFITIIYFPFVCAEFCGVSGIVTLLTSAVCSQRFVLPNVSVRTVLEAEALFRTVAHLSEVSIFLILGMSVFAICERVNPNSVDAVFVAWVVVACMIGRFFQVYFLTGLYNYVLRSKSARKIKTRHMHMMGLSGLRGAVAFACASNFPNTNDKRDDVVFVTMIVVLLSVFCLGGLTDSALQWLKIETEVNEEEFLDDFELTQMEKKKESGLRAVATSFFEGLSKICLTEADWTRRSITQHHGGSLTDFLRDASSASLLKSSSIGNDCHTYIPRHRSTASPVPSSHPQLDPIPSSSVDSSDASVVLRSRPLRSSSTPVPSKTIVDHSGGLNREDNAPGEEVIDDSGGGYGSSTAYASSAAEESVHHGPHAGKGRYLPPPPLSNNSPPRDPNDTTLGYHNSLDSSGPLDSSGAGSRSYYLTYDNDANLPSKDGTARTTSSNDNNDSKKVSTDNDEAGYHYSGTEGYASTHAPLHQNGGVSLSQPLLPPHTQHQRASEPSAQPQPTNNHLQRHRQQQPQPQPSDIARNRRRKKRKSLYDFGRNNIVFKKHSEYDPENNTSED